MKKSGNACSSCSKFPLWVVLPFLTILTIIFITTSMNAFAETIVIIPNEAAEPSCTESNSCFLPSEVNVGVGETVTWSNDSTVIHTVTSGNSEEGSNGLFDSSIIIASGTFSHTFTETGQYNYFCAIHPWMTGTIMVN